MYTKLKKTFQEKNYYLEKQMKNTLTIIFAYIYYRFLLVENLLS